MAGPNVLLVSFVLLTLVTLSESIICYSCHSTEKSACGDHFKILTSDLDSRFECQGSCFKRRGKRTSGEVRRTEVGRGCITYQKEHCYTETKNSMEQYTCICNTNFCNTASTSYLSSFSLWFCIFISFCFKMY